MAQTNQNKNIIDSLSHEEKCLLERIMFNDISSPSFTSTTKIRSEYRFHALNNGSTLPDLSPDIELSLINFFKSEKDPWFEDKNENYSSKTKIAKIAEIGFQLMNNELLWANNEHNTITDDNEH